jgi:hypothetical protein
MQHTLTEINARVDKGQCICPRGSEREKLGTNAYRCVKSAAQCDPGWTQVGREKAKTLVKQGWQIRQVGKLLCAKRRK